MDLVETIVESRFAFGPVSMPRLTNPASQDFPHFPSWAPRQTDPETGSALITLTQDTLNAALLPDCTDMNMAFANAKHTLFESTAE